MTPAERAERSKIRRIVARDVESPADPEVDEAPEVEDEVE